MKRRSLALISAMVALVLLTAAFPSTSRVARADDGEHRDHGDRDTTQSCPPPPSGLVSWWRAEGNATDSADSNNGTLQNVTFAAGKCGRAFSFNGANSAVNILKHSNLNMGAGDFTVTAWVKFTAALPGTGQTIIFLNYAGDPTYLLSIQGESQRAIAYFRDGAGNFVQAVGTTSLNDREWHHLAAIRSGTSALIYVDGLLQNLATNPLVGAVNTSGCQYARIGAAATGPGHCSSPTSTEAFFKGSIDEVQVYNRALSASVIARLAHSHSDDHQGEDHGGGSDDHGQH